MDPPPYPVDSKGASALSLQQSFPPPPTQTPQATQPLYPGYPYPNQQSYPNQQPYTNQQQYTSQPQQQQPYYGNQPSPQSVMIVNSGQPQVIYAPSRPYQSFCGHIVLACFVAWCCGFLFGIIAFILALVARNSSETGNSNEARKLGWASLGVSIAGIVVTCIIVAIAVGVSASKSTTSDCYCKATYSGAFAYRSCYLCYSY